MSKIKFKFKITGLELEFEGSREDVPMITTALGNQFQSMINPPAEISAGHVEVIDSTPKVMLSNAPKKRRKSPKPASANGQESHKKESNALTWRHDPKKYSSPLQGWKVWQKAIWTIYVVSKECNVDELSGPQIVEIFNREFKSAGTIRGTNISRDLGKLKLGKDALVGETVGNPSRWFLTDKGEEEVLKLIETDNNAK